MKTIKITNLKSITWIAMLFCSLTSCTKNKLKCTGDSEKNFALSNFSKVQAGDNFNISIIQGATCSIKATGCTESINDLDLSVGSGSVLKIKYRTNNLVHETINILITVPELTNLDVSAASNVTVNGIANQATYLRIVLSGAAECMVNGTPSEVTFDLSGASKLDIFGNTDIFNGKLSGASHVRAYGLAAKQTDIDASGASDARVTAQHKLYAEASGASTIYYKGNPAQIFTNTSGSSKIIKE